MTRCDDSGTHGGDEFTSYGAANEATKNRENKTDRGLRGPLDNKFDTTTNQKHAGTTIGDILDARPDGDVRGARSHQFWGDRVGRRLKNELK
jgi:hypothetical protein